MNGLINELEKRWTLLWLLTNGFIYVEHQLVVREQVRREVCYA